MCLRVVGQLEVVELEPRRHHARDQREAVGTGDHVGFLPPAGRHDVLQLLVGLRPDLDMQGLLAWDPREFSFVLTVGADGVPELERRIDGGAPRRVARFVERVTFDDFESSGFAVATNTVRVRIWLRGRDANGHLHRDFVEGTTLLRNGGFGR